MYYSDENDFEFDSEEDINDTNYLIDNDNNFNQIVEIINFYKDKLIREPTFIGINRLCAMAIMNIINMCSNNKFTSPINICNISYEEYIIIEDLLCELNIKNITTNLVNDVANNIYYELYV
tara:strand:+ start:188 stop:550 length:363 start_codon:yes stop_codon:yes gene_type:complete